jgi:lipopolysaccharide/colanic/teichoic acid biosynthesis glycosyltransferase
VSTGGGRDRRLPSSRQPEHEAGVDGALAVQREWRGEEAVRLDCEYIDHWSLWLDFEIVVKSVTKVMRGDAR